MHKETVNVDNDSLERSIKEPYTETFDETIIRKSTNRDVLRGYNSNDLWVRDLFLKIIEEGE